uniref:Peptidase S1 domain-containing protein n=1 Tax=Anopheles funestus TaxID=62324 RepID=A0A4Y0BEU8_ANOFN
MYCAMRGFILVVIVWTASTEQSISEVRSLSMHDRHVCNAVQLEREFFITPAACLSAREQGEFELIGRDRFSPKVTSKTQCYVTKYQSHPKYIFLNYNIALIQVQCGQSLREVQNTSISDSKTNDHLTLVGINNSLRRVSTHLETQKCGLCQKEYAEFSCKRQICLKLSRKVTQKLSTVEGLVGAGIFTQNAKLVGVLSYGFANGSLVAERVIYYKQFLHRTMQEFQRGKNNSPSF